MESPDFTPPRVDASRPTLGFPLGTALLLIVIFSLSGIFACCYHWDKLRSLRRSFSHDAPTAAPDDVEASPSKSNPAHMDLKENQSISLPVLMPGDRVPKFIALRCPREPPRAEHAVVEVQKPPYKPPRLPPVPLYL